MTIQLPPSSPGAAAETMSPPFRLVVVGANGSGKTRFGIWLEQQNQGSRIVHRLSAQKALGIPDRAAMKTLEQAEKDLLYGRHDQHASPARKIHDRWGNNPSTHLLSDYEALVALLFAKDAERDRLHTLETRKTGGYVPVSDSLIDQIVATWGNLMPHRTISFGDGKVLVGKGTPGEYHAKEMSDGERVTLYLLGQCLAAPSNSMIIIDEPELHLHRALMDKLWNTVEEKCADKTIVYITHDLDFAASRVDARKIWIKSFTGSDWTWADVPQNDVLPEPLLLEVIGSRKPTLFCEGERGGLDHTIYQICFTGMHVVPRGGSDQVVEATKALRSMPSIHSMEPRGIVDRDVRSDSEILALENQGIAVLAFAEIENVLCSESVVREMAAQMKLNPDEKVAEVREFVTDALKEEFDAQVALRASRRIRYHLSQYSAPDSDPANLGAGVTSLVSRLDVAAVVAEERRILTDAINAGELDGILKVYNRKSIVDRISPILGLKLGEYAAMGIRMLKASEDTKLAASVRSLLPSL